jgi:hypothetical protein
LESVSWLVLALPSCWLNLTPLASQRKSKPSRSSSRQPAARTRSVSVEGEQGDQEQGANWSICVAVTIKKTGDKTKFKVRCSRYLYTMSVKDAEKVEKLRKSLPPCKPSLFS